MAGRPLDALPAWAAQIAPVDMDGAAVALGISRRTLVDIIKRHPHFERRGARKVFYPEHISGTGQQAEPPETAEVVGVAGGNPLPSHGRGHRFNPCRAHHQNGGVSCGFRG